MKKIHDIDLNKIYNIFIYVVFDFFYLIFQISI
jgi:hypothetical protein